MRNLEDFNIAFEYDNAARIPFERFELRLVDSKMPLGFDAADGVYYPAVWENHDKFVVGYQTDNRLCVVFLDWPVADLASAIAFAERVAGLSSEHSKGVR